ncbi:MAG: oxygen-independent coproporphyrinogen III oxidase [Burkholderiales bacterium]|nr:oxygen-independent coproporphyrinogen III oxidase [Burkholderiales bacterium]
MIAQATPVIDPEMLRRYDVSGPRYTSYPTADRFVEAFDADTYVSWLERRHIGGVARPLSLYVHVPFCSDICFYCACNKVVTRDHAKSARYLSYLDREIAQVATVLQGDRRLDQMHWGGGTPTFLTPAELRALMGIVRSRFRLVEGGEYSIEVDPRSVEPGTITLLAELGFNRISVGVQDFDPVVQTAIHRAQSVEQTWATLSEAYKAGFESINIDLVYGLPKQTRASFDRTLDMVVTLSPDRIALFGYAHLPQAFKAQRRFAEADLPDGEARLDMLSLAIRRLTGAGYVYIGMDHFALPDDELAVAQRQGRLHRNFQGYSTRSDCDLIPLGITSIGSVGPTYVQNAKILDDYYDRLDRGLLPVLRGVELTADDLLRRALIQSLMCHGSVSIESLELAHMVDFDTYFADELADLRPMIEDGLVHRDADWLAVTDRGRLLVRSVCMVFDRYLRQRRAGASYSRVI